MLARNSSSCLASMTGPLMISWDVTNLCNFNCVHCLNCSGDGNHHDFVNELSEKEAESLAYQIAELHPISMCICGGEPTLRQDLEHIISIIARAGTQVNMVSNGYSLSFDRIRELKQAGLSFLQISLDGVEPQTHDNFRNRTGAFERAVDAISSAVKCKMRVATSFCPNKYNICEFRRYVDFIHQLGCRHIRMMPFLPMGRGLENAEAIMPSEDNYFTFKCFINEKRKQYKDMQIEWGDPLEHIYLALYNPRPEPVVMEIRANGDIAPSIYLPISVGNVRRHSIKEYWDAGFKDIWRHPEVTAIAQTVNTIYDFFDMSLHTWNIKRKEIDLIEQQ